MRIDERILLGVQRWRRALSLGVAYRGTSRPASLSNIRIAGGIRTIQKPSHSGHWHDFINVVLDDEYGLRKIRKPPGTILDLGGNVGIFSLWARHCFPEAKIQCYEPNPCLWSSIAANLSGLDVEIREAAVGVACGRATLLTSSDDRCSAMSAVGEGDIVVESFSDVVSRLGHIDLLKIDIEGGEWQIFRESDASVFEEIQRIVLEYHELEGRTRADLEIFALNLGYNIELIRPNSGFGIAWLQRK